MFFGWLNFRDKSPHWGAKIHEFPIDDMEERHKKDGYPAPDYQTGGYDSSLVHRESTQAAWTLMIWRRRSMLCMIGMLIRG